MKWDVDAIYVTPIGEWEQLVLTPSQVLGQIVVQVTTDMEQIGEDTCALGGFHQALSYASILVAEIGMNATDILSHQQDV